MGGGAQRIVSVFGSCVANKRVCGGNCVKLVVLFTPFEYDFDLLIVDL